MSAAANDDAGILSRMQWDLFVPLQHETATVVKITQSMEGCSPERKVLGCAYAVREYGVEWSGSLHSKYIIACSDFRIGKREDLSRPS